MKFWKLFKKELRELLTLQSLIGMGVGLLVFLLLGQVMGSVTEEISKNGGTVAVCDMDQSPLSRQLIEALRETYTVTELSEEDDAALAEQAEEKTGHSSLLAFPKGFGAGIESGAPQELRIITKLTSFSIFSNMSNSAAAAAQLVRQSLATRLIEAGGTGDAEFVQNPIRLTDITVANGKTDIVNASALQSFAMQQTIFIPIIIFILITFASQLNVASIANEKGDKTLETLLSAPVSRLSVLGAKMCSSAVLSLLTAGVYMLGFSGYMGSMMSGAAGGGSDGGITLALQSLGLQLGPLQFALIGLQLFLTIMIALAASMILGVLAKDVKSANGLVMPLMFLAMIPYFVTIFMDMGALPMPAQILLYLIPFTHTYIASANLLFGNFALFFAGLAYQAVLLVLVMAAAVHVFSTDKIFTMTLDFTKKRGGKKAVSE